jgi:hypothetical protein
MARGIYHAPRPSAPGSRYSFEVFWNCFRAHPAADTPHRFVESFEKGHGRIETRRCRAFAQLDCLHKPEQWPGLKSLAVVESQREINGKTTLERRL